MAEKKGIPDEIRPAFDELLRGFAALMDAGCCLDESTDEGQFFLAIADAIEKYETAVIDL